MHARNRGACVPVRMPLLCAVYLEEHTLAILIPTHENIIVYKCACCHDDKDADRCF